MWWVNTTIDGYNEYNMIEGYNDVMIQWIQCDGWYNDVMDTMDTTWSMDTMMWWYNGYNVMNWYNGYNVMDGNNGYDVTNNLKHLPPLLPVVMDYNLE